MEHLPRPSALPRAAGMVLLLLAAACQGDGARRRPAARDGAPPADAAGAGVDSSPIRSVDFANFTHPNLSGYGSPWALRQGTRDTTETTVDTVDGRPRTLPVRHLVDLREVEYGELTGDGAEEAVVSLGWSTGGSGTFGYVLVYGMDGGAPRLLWSGSAGDRASGGIRSARAEGGALVVELFGWNQLLDRDPEAPSEGPRTPACCPTHFTRARYRWDGSRFTLQGTPEVLPLPAQDPA